MKKEYIKKPREFPYCKYSDNINGIKLTCRIFEDMGGEYELTNRKTKEYRADAFLPDWILTLENEIKQKQILLDFLSEVQYDIDNYGIGDAK